jgi:hypothetical protein
MRRLTLALLCFVITATTTKAATVTLTWTPPILRVDGTTLSDTGIAGADIYDSCPCIPPTPTPSPIGSVVGSVGTFKTGQLLAGTHTFTVITRDGSVPQLSSAPSNPFAATIVNSHVPATITNLTGTIGP